MGRRLLALSLALVLGGCAGGAAGESRVVERVVDGDTIALASGERVRLVQIDAPEAAEGECYGEEATRELERLLPRGTVVRLVGDPVLDDLDRFGRLLRYVYRGDENVNLTLVERGAASVWFFQGDRGRHAGALFRAAREAEGAGHGLWGACPAAELDPFAAVAT